MVADAVDLEPVSSLQFGQMQGDFAKKQGGDVFDPAKSFLISQAWNELSLLYEQRGYSSIAARSESLQQRQDTIFGVGLAQGVSFVTESRQLPLVDPDFRLVERRAEMLHAYARGLLQHLRIIRAGGKAEGYPIATIKSAMVWLIESYAEARVPPTPEAARLVSEIVRPHPHTSTLPVRRSSEAAYWAAIEFEASQRPDPTGKEPSVAKRYAVAKHVLGLLKNKNGSQKAAESTVRGWRKLAHYRDNVRLQRPAP